MITGFEVTVIRTEKQARPFRLIRFIVIVQYTFRRDNKESESRRQRCIPSDETKINSPLYRTESTINLHEHMMLPAPAFSSLGCIKYIFLGGILFYLLQLSIRPNTGRIIPRTFGAMFHPCIVCHVLKPSLNDVC